MKVTHQQALEKLTAALADGVEPEWEEQIAAVMRFLSETDGVIDDNGCGCSNPKTAAKLQHDVLIHTGFLVCDDVAAAAADIATA